MISKEEFLTYFKNENHSLSRDNLYVIYEFLTTLIVDMDIKFNFSKEYITSYKFLLNKDIQDRINKLYYSNYFNVDYWNYMINNDKEISKQRDRNMLAFFEKKTGKKKDYGSLHNYVRIIIHHLIPIDKERILIYQGKIVIALKEEEEKERKMREKRNKKKKEGGIYGMYENGELVYIGMTLRKFEDRWQEHLDNIAAHNNKLDFYKYVSKDSKIEFKKLIQIKNLQANVELTKRDIEAMEFALIQEHQPKYNLAGRTMKYIFST